MRRDEDVVALPRSAKQRTARSLAVLLSGKDIDRNTEEQAAPYRLGQRGFVDHRSAGRIDEDGPSLELPDRGPIDEIPVIRGGRDVHGNDIGMAQKLVERDRPCRRTDVRFVARDHVHSERSGIARHHGADAPIANYAQAFALKLPAPKSVTI